MTKELDAKNAEKSRRACAAMEDMANSMRRCGEVRQDCEKGATTAATADAVSHPSHYTSGGIEAKDALMGEIADIIQACCNLAAALGVTNLTPYLDACEERNRERGRYGD